MPVLTEQEITNLLLANLENLSINLDSETRELAKKQSEEYFQNNHTLVDNPLPLSFYYIISRLPEAAQITFIINHLAFIEAYEQEIFLYKYMSPESLSTFLSLNVIRVIHDISPKIFKNLINNNISNLFNGFSHQDYLNFYIDYISEISKIDNLSFIASVFNHKYWHPIKQYHLDDENGLIDLTAEINQKAIYDKELISLILKEYSHKINTFSSFELLSFIKNIDDYQLMSDFIAKYHSQLITAFSNISTIELKDIISEYSSCQQKIIFDEFYNTILKYHPFSNLIEDLNSVVIVDLCTHNPELLSYLTIEDWLRVSIYYPPIDQKLTNIFDQYEITNPQILFKNLTSRLKTEHPDYEIFKYLELKYRKNLRPTGNLFQINAKTSPFSHEFIQNLTELHYLFKTHQIDKNSLLYQQHLLIFLNFLNQKAIIDISDDLMLKIVDTVFYRIVKGAPLSDLYQIYSPEGLTILSRLKEVPFLPNEFTVKQLLTYNVKHHKKLSTNFKDIRHITSYQTLTLKLMLLIGYHHAKTLLNINHQLPVLEHLVGSINVENITFDNQGNPNLNQKIINLLFNDKNYSLIKSMLTNQDSDLYKYFPRIFNEWDNIKLNHKDKSLKTVLEYLKGANITLSPEYYRLEDKFKHIGSTPKLINETLKLHNQMLTRTSSTIPRVIGTQDDYSYEILELHDMEGLTVGNQTDCCFTICGASSSSLKHATTSPNGRIFVIRKNHQLIAHSWLWRNGDLLCFDNIEIAKHIKSIDFLSLYLEAINKILSISATIEGPENCLKNVTIGHNSFDKPILGIDKYLSITTNHQNTISNSNVLVKEKLPSPLEKVSYSDAKYTQYLIVGTDKFNSREVIPCYQDARPDIMCYQNNQTYPDDYIKKLTQKINSLTYLKAKENHQLEYYEIVALNNYQEIYCTDDWYDVTYLDGHHDSFIYSHDERAISEMNLIKNKKIKIKKR